MACPLPPLLVLEEPDAVGRADDRHLYALSTPSALARGRYKIGVAADVARRERQLSTGQDEELRACFVWPHEEALEPFVLRALPSPGGGRGREWRVATEAELLEAVRLARLEWRRLHALPPPVPRSRRQLERLEARLEGLAYTPRLRPY